jgi:hypothetical protein
MANIRHFTELKAYHIPEFMSVPTVLCLQNILALQLDLNVLHLLINSLYFKRSHRLSFLEKEILI